MGTRRPERLDTILKDEDKGVRYRRVDGCQNLSMRPVKIDCASRHRRAFPYTLHHSHGAQPMTAMALHIVPDDSFDDWVLRDDSGYELGHYPTREEAEQVGQRVARAREIDLVVHLPDGGTNRISYRRSWFRRLFGG